MLQCHLIVSPVLFVAEALTKTWWSKRVGFSYLFAFLMMLYHNGFLINFLV